MNRHVLDKAEKTGSGGHRARLRQRLLEAGPAGFHDYELIEYLLTLTIPRVDTKPLAKRLILSFGGIGPLLSASRRRRSRSMASVCMRRFYPVRCSACAPLPLRC